MSHETRAYYFREINISGNFRIIFNRNFRLTHKLTECLDRFIEYYFTNYKLIILRKPFHELLQCSTVTFCVGFNATNTNKSLINANLLLDPNTYRSNQRGCVEKVVFVKTYN